MPLFEGTQQMELDMLLNPVLDWWQQTGRGLGEVKDRLEDLRRRRQVNARMEEMYIKSFPLPDKPLDLDIEEVQKMRALGYGVKDIAREKGLPIHAVHDFARRNLFAESRGE